MVPSTYKMKIERMRYIVRKESFKETEIEKPYVYEKILGGIGMITTRISREKLYRREYERDTLVKEERINIQEDMITESLAKILTLMITEKGVILK